MFNSGKSFLTSYFKSLTMCSKNLSDFSFSSFEIPYKNPSAKVSLDIALAISNSSEWRLFSVVQTGVGI